MYFAIKWPKAMASLALPGAIDAVREKKIIAVSLGRISSTRRSCASPFGPPRSRRSTRPPAELVGAQRFIRELFAGNVGGEHEPALCDREDRHAGLIVAVRGGIRRCAARLR